MPIDGPKSTPEHNCKRSTSVAVMNMQLGGASHSNSETLAKHEVPILGALGHQERAHDEDSTRNQERDPEVSDVEEPAEDETGEEHQRVLHRTDPCTDNPGQTVRGGTRARKAYIVDDGVPLSRTSS